MTQCWALDTQSYLRYYCRPGAGGSGSGLLSARPGMRGDGALISAKPGVRADGSLMSARLDNHMAQVRILLTAALLLTARSGKTTVLSI
jgi:hypothetical protein